MNKRAIEHANKLRAALAEMAGHRNALVAMGYTVEIIGDGQVAIEKLTREEL